MNQSISKENQWLFGPLPDLFLGCGLLYVVLFLLLSFTGAEIRSVIPFELTPIILLIISIPHYGATLLRVYEKQEDRIKYKLFSHYFTALVWTLFVIGIYNAYIGSILITLYLIWSPWHYMGQNYGIALMFLGRRGITIPIHTKRLLHLSFFCSYLLTLVEIQSIPTSEGHYSILTLEISNSVRDGAFLILGCIYAYATASVAMVLIKRASLLAILPTALLIASQALWFLVPIIAVRMNLFQDTVSLSTEHAAYAFLYIAIGHSIQYLWITSYFAKKNGNESFVTAFLGKALVAGAIIWVLPAVIFAPGVLGQVTYENGLALLIAAAVNIHHFILDGAIWKLRNGPIARILLFEVKDKLEKATQLSIAYPRIAFYVVGVLCICTFYIASVDTMAAKRAWQQNDIQKMSETAERLYWLGRDSSWLRSSLSTKLAEKGDINKAIEHGEAAVEIDPKESNWINLGLIYEYDGQIIRALEATQEALWIASDPEIYATQIERQMNLGLSSGGNVRKIVLSTAQLIVDRFRNNNAVLLNISADIFLKAGLNIEATTARLQAQEVSKMEKNYDSESGFVRKPTVPDKRIMLFSN